MKKVLIAGIGNIFFGDDAFGCEVVKLLQKDSLPNSVKLVDFGIRTRDLAYELCENYDVIILIDAVKLGNSSGTVSLIELSPDDFSAQNPYVSHEAKLEETLSFAKNLGAKINKIHLVGFEAENFELNQDLSLQAHEAVLKSQKIIKNLLDKFL